jgi:monofunctional biosynthetic peptidoglycan transglycosylase
MPPEGSCKLFSSKVFDGRAVLDPVSRQKLLLSTVLAAVLLALSPGLASPEAQAAEEPSMIEHELYSFEDDGGSAGWTIVNDGVMGGISRSRLSLSGEGTALFEGFLSLENNGGFASVRTRPERLPTAGTSRLVVRLRGDGREYQLRIRTSRAFDGVAYRWSFTAPAGEWAVLEAPYREFVPTFRGRILRDVPPIAPEKIRQLGLMIADKKEGPFRLEVDWIRAVE